MKNVMFKETPIDRPNLRPFDLSHEVKSSFQIGKLIPFMWFDVTPGDKFKVRSENLVKLSPMLAPVLHRMDVYTHFFFVPYRIIFKPYSDSYGGWEEFITGDPDGLYTNNELPYVTISNANKAYFAESTLADYLGLPVIDSGTTVSQDIDINVLPFYAYHLIYDDYYRDENLITKITGTGAAQVWLRGGDRNSYIQYICRTAPHKRAYEKDYFKGALPEAYYGSSADVELDLDILGALRLTTDAAGGAGIPTAGAIGSTGVYSISDDLSGTPAPLYFQDHSSTAKSKLELLELRRAQAFVRFLEAQNRGGSRYIEMILGVYGVIATSDLLDYPRYLGGGKQAVKISSILNQSQVLDPTAGVNDGAGGVPVTVDPQSLETGRGLSVGSTNTFNASFKEHGIIMGIISVLPRTAYGGAQIEKYWRKSDRTEFFAPQFQNIGDQEILQSEIGYDATGSDADDVFGYAPRWSEYKFKNSTVHGAFLSTLNYWHMAEIGDTSGAGPSLNQAYIECDYDEDGNIRIFADQTAEDHLFVQIYNDVLAWRPMQVFDTPR